jgi:threonylcarbamoyladenosine tRNA methylthiotransferase MtaB
MMSKKTFAFHTLGCKLNFAESTAIGRKLVKEGLIELNFNEKSDIYIINSCSVTENADKECAYWVRKAKRISPSSKVLIIGCYAQLKPESIINIPGVDAVLGANEKFNVHIWLEKLLQNDLQLMQACNIDDVNGFHSAYSLGERTRSFLKVQDGCDYSCTFCTIPLARGRSRSDDLVNVLNNAKELVGNGVKEIVLTGINLGDYGKGINGGKNRKLKFIKLLKSMEKIDGLERVRISSIEPNLLDDEIISFVSTSSKIVPHFHIPLQSGSDYILRRMKRRYLSKLYKERVYKIKELMPHCSIGVDVIVGFPGETEEYFMETVNFLKSLPVSYFHVFSYSERNNTKAIEMSDVVPVSRRRQRSKILRDLSLKKKRQFYSDSINSQRKVLFESKIKDSMLEGWTDNYIKVAVPYDESLVNQIVDAKLVDFDEQGRVLTKMLSNVS